jgi:hypothetical protein
MAEKSGLRTAQSRSLAAKELFFSLDRQTYFIYES